jgi:hypothetical protein
MTFGIGHMSVDLLERMAVEAPRGLKIRYPANLKLEAAPDRLRPGAARRRSPPSYLESLGLGCLVTANLCIVPLVMWLRG